MCRWCGWWRGSWGLGLCKIVIIFTVRDLSQRGFQAVKVGLHVICCGGLLMGHWGRGRWRGFGQPGAIS